MEINIEKTRTGRKHSSNGKIHVVVDANAVFNPLKKKGGFKILKKPIYYSGILSCLLVLITFTFVFVGCEKVKTLINGVAVQGNEKTEVSITDFSMDNSTCRWNYKSIILDSIYLINSNEDFLTLISCNDDIPTPVIDFDQYSLLLVYGRNTYGYNDITKSLYQLPVISKNKSIQIEYELNIEITLNVTAMPLSWIVAVLTPKLPQDIIITLNKVEHF